MLFLKVVATLNKLILTLFSLFFLNILNIGIDCAKNFNGISLAKN